MRQVPRADQLVEGAAGDVKQLRGFIGIKERLGQPSGVSLIFD
jgi:hypothetical protein